MRKISLVLLAVTLVVSCTKSPETVLAPVSSEAVSSGLTITMSETTDERGFLKVKQGEIYHNKELGVAFVVDVFGYDNNWGIKVEGNKILAFTDHDTRYIPSFIEVIKREVPDKVGLLTFVTKEGKDQSQCKVTRLQDNNGNYTDDYIIEPIEKVQDLDIEATNKKWIDLCGSYAGVTNQYGFSNRVTQNKFIRPGWNLSIFQFGQSFYRWEVLIAQDSAE